MERESFENEDIAALMNAHFVCVKVDREERPDLDDVYMAATLALNQGQGGWPMTVFLTPEQQPFFAGTYFPPDDRYGRPGFPHAARAHRGGAGRPTATGCARRAARSSSTCARARPRRPAASLGERPSCDRRPRSSRPTSTSASAASARAPKFPPSGALLLLLRVHRRTGTRARSRWSRKTLDEMARGGMYDQLGGGFHRYSVDERWLVPHFEKMLYDNALLARTYLEAYQVDGRRRSTRGSPARSSTTCGAR